MVSDNYGRDNYALEMEVHKREREQIVYLTQGESSWIPYHVYIRDNKYSIDYKNATVEFRATLPDGTFVNQLIDSKDIDSVTGQIKWYPVGALTQTYGRITVAHFVITNEDKVIKTRNMTIEIEKTPDLSGKESEAFISQVDDVKERVIAVGLQVSKIEHEITKNPEKFRGLQGEQGIQGVQGVPGVKGDTGDVSLEQLNSVIDYFTPQQGAFNAINELSGAVFNWVMSANTITLTLGYKNNKAFGDGDVHIGDLPAGLPLPRVYGARGTFVNVSGKTGGANTVGSIRIQSDGKIVMNWNESFAGGVSQYLEFGLTYISDRKFNEPVVVVGAEKKP